MSPWLLVTFNIDFSFLLNQDGFSGHTFEMPDLKIKSVDEQYSETQSEDIANAKKQFAEEVKSEDIKYRPGVPTFFGL